MGDNRLVKVAIAAAVAAGLGCGLAGPASAQSLTDRFKSLFGGKSDEPAQSGATRRARAGRSGDSDLSAGHDPRRRVDLCGGRARQAGGRQRSALPGDDHQDRARMQPQWRRDHRADRHSGTRHCRSRRRAVVGPGSDPRRRGAGRRLAKRSSPPRPTRPRCTMTETGSEPFTLVAEDLVYPVPPGRGRRHLHLLYRLRPAGPEAGTPAPRKKK